MTAIRINELDADPNNANVATGDKLVVQRSGVDYQANMPSVPHLDSNGRLADSTLPTGLKERYYYEKFNSYQTSADWFSPQASVGVFSVEIAPFKMKLHEMTVLFNGTQSINYNSNQRVWFIINADGTDRAFNQANHRQNLSYRYSVNAPDPAGGQYGYVQLESLADFDAGENQYASNTDTSADIYVTASELVIYKGSRFVVYVRAINVDLSFRPMVVFKEVIE